MWINERVFFNKNIYVHKFNNYTYPFCIKKTYAYYFFSIWGFIYDFNKNTEILVKRHKFYFISNLKSHTLNKISFTSINVDNILTI